LVSVVEKPLQDSLIKYQETLIKGLS